MDIILFETSTTAEAEAIVEAVQAQDLWGVNMGTTSKASSNSSFVLIEATPTRVLNLIAAVPDTVDLVLQYADPPSFNNSTPDEMAWYLRGKI